MTIGLITKLAKVTDKLLRMTGVNGSDELSYIRGDQRKAANTVKSIIDGIPINIMEFAEYATGYIAGGDPSTWDWTPALKALHASKPKAVIISGKLKFTGGLAPTLYEWKDTTFIFLKAEVILDTPVADNVIFQIGSDCVGYGSVKGSVVNGTGNGNGFVRVPFCFGRWWDSLEVSNIHFDTLKLTGLPNGTAMAIAGNTHGVRIERVELGGGQLGIMMHWCGLPNNVAPTITYHPHDIHIGSVVGSGYTDAMITESACYDVRIDYINGKNNYRDFSHIGGDFGETLANPRDVGRVCRGNSIGRLETSGSLYRAVDYNASAGLVTGIMAGEFSIDSVKAIGTGLVSSVGIRIENRDGGRIGFTDISGFANNIVFINCTGGSDGELGSSQAVNQGIIYSSTKHVRADKWKTTNDNQASGGGVGGVSINATCADVEVGLLRATTNNTTTHGCTLATGSSNIRIRQANGVVDASRVLVVDSAVANSNRIGPCVLDSGVTSYSGSDPFSITNARGNVIGWGSAPPSAGTFKVGDLLYKTVSLPVGKSGWRCSVSGSPGTWEEMGT